MCGRYRLSRRKQLIEEYFETDNEVDWEPRYNIAPSQPVGMIRQDPSPLRPRWILTNYSDRLRRGDIVARLPIDLVICLEIFLDHLLASGQTIAATPLT